MSTSLLELRQTAAELGDRIYRDRLSAFESQYAGRFVAIFIPTGEYFVADSLIEAADKLHANYPNAGPGEVYTRRFGDRAVFYSRTPRIK